MHKGWLGLPYRPISEFYRERFSGKVYKIPVSVVDDCPNRRGLKGMQTCVFCDVWGSAAKSESVTMELRAQIEKYQKNILKKYKAEHFLVYFQAYTNTFTKLEALRANFETALSYDFVKGLVVGTRPDCLSPAVMALWQEHREKAFVAVELGVQTFDDRQLEFLRRGHTRAQSLKAIDTITKNTTVDLGIHLMFGNPGETDEQIIEAARICNDLPITNVKLHNLHVLKNTPLEQMYQQGQFSPIEREPYARRVQLFLEHLSPRIFIHRLAAFSSRWDECVAPSWTCDKMGTHQYLLDYLRERRSFQGKALSSLPSLSAEERKLWIDLQRRGEPEGQAF
jgi:radical SAM protein (TIGR01212 family)